MFKSRPGTHLTQGGIIKTNQYKPPDHKSFGGQLNGLLLYKEHLKNDLKKETVAGTVE